MESVMQISQRILIKNRNTHTHPRNTQHIKIYLLYMLASIKERKMNSTKLIKDY